MEVLIFFICIIRVFGILIFFILDFFIGVINFCIWVINEIVGIFLMEDINFLGVDFIEKGCLFISWFLDFIVSIVIVLSFFIIFGFFFFINVGVDIIKGNLIFFFNIIEVFLGLVMIFLIMLSLVMDVLIFELVVFLMKILIIFLFNFGIFSILVFLGFIFFNGVIFLLEVIFCIVIVFVLGIMFLIEEVGFIGLDFIVRVCCFMNGFVDFNLGLILDLIFFVIFWICLFFYKVFDMIKGSIFFFCIVGVVLLIKIFGLVG